MSRESRDFKRAEMACELAHEDREYNTQSSKSIAYAKFKRLKGIANRNEIQDLELLALKRRYSWY